MRKTLMHPNKDAEFVNYFGAKNGSGVAARIISQMPPHDVYIEPYAGSARVARMKKPAICNLLYDVDPDVIQRLKADPADNFTFFKILRRDARSIIEDCEAFMRQGKTLLYLDPPYPECVRGRDRYRYDCRSDDYHRGLCLSLTCLRCMVIISSYPNPICDGILTGWRTVDIPTMTRGGKRIERLWCNFPEPTYLHDPRFAGRTHRERWKLSKRMARLRAKYLALPPAERQMMFAELTAADGEVVRLWRNGS